jgi:hypothetical protein
LIEEKDKLDEHNYTLRDEVKELKEKVEKLIKEKEDL